MTDYQDSTDGKITYKAIQDRAEQDAEERMPELPKVSEKILYADSARGIYIPQHFAESIYRSKCDAPESDLDQLAQGPDSCEGYWDIWADVMDNTIITDSEGQEWRLEQDGDLWLVPVDAIENWESFIQELEDLDVYDIAHECSDWDWVIYYHRALELCQAVPSIVLDQAESDLEDIGGPAQTRLYELANQLAILIVVREIVDALEVQKEELIELAQDKINQLESN